MKIAKAAVGKKRQIFKGTFAAIRGHKDGIIFFNDIIKIWQTWVVGSDKYCTTVGFLVLVVESVFTWDIESFVDLCFDVVSCIKVSKDSLYFRCPDEEQFYTLEILAFRKLKL